jgi:hypothetical protein
MKILLTTHVEITADITKVLFERIIEQICSDERMFKLLIADERYYGTLDIRPRRRVLCK